MCGLSCLAAVTEHTLFRLPSWSPASELHTLLLSNSTPGPPLGSLQRPQALATCQWKNQGISQHQCSCGGRGGSDPRQVRAAPLSRTWHQADQSHLHFLLPRLSPLPLTPPHPPRDVSSVELLMKYHQGIRAEIDTRSKNFNACLELGESLLQREHQASEEVRGTVGQPASSVLPPLSLDQTASWRGSPSFPPWSIGVRAPPHPLRGWLLGRESRLITRLSPTCVQAL